VAAAQRAPMNAVVPWCAARLKVVDLLRAA
jgi:hypothetical protein